MPWVPPCAVDIARASQHRRRVCNPQRVLAARLVRFPDVRLRVRVLGEIDVVVGGRATAITSRSQRVVLGLLAARANTVVAADVLLDAVWAESPPPSALSSLRTYVSRLRRIAGGAIAGTAGGYRLDVSEDELDLLHFERLLADASAAGSPASALASLDDALVLWRGSPFGDVGDLEAIRPVTARLEERWVAAREGRAAALLAVGRAHDAVAAAEELVAEHPLRERSWTILVDGLSATARPTEALRAYQRAVEVLADAGLAPTAQLRRAEAAALAEDEDRPAPARRQLPRPTSSFVGRAQDRERLARLLLDRSVVTLVGPGGVGKTRLARTVAADVQHRFTWGVRLVELAAIEDPAQVADVIAGDLGITVGPEGPQAALAEAGDLDVLVIIDNCEHVVDAAADAVGHLTSGGKQLRVLATSREPLAIDGEQRWPVAPLPIDDADGAPQLFLERACSVRPDFEPDASEREVIRDVVQRLDGLPLAVEMAAAALRVMSLRELAARLDSEPDLPELTRRDVHERHRTLGRLVDWSIRLLDEEARQVLFAMAVFSGSVDAEDVAAVSRHPSPFDVLCRLADRSLVLIDTSRDTARFHMLRTIRQAALAAAHDVPDLRARHAGWLVDAVSIADQQLRGPNELPAQERIEQLLDDARAAIRWTHVHDRASAVRLAARCYLFGQSRLRDEVLGWATEVVRQGTDDLAGSDGQLVVTAAAQQAVNRGDLHQARELATRAAAIGGDALPLALEVLSDVQLFSGELVEAGRTARRGLEAATAAGDAHGTVVSLACLVLANAYVGDHAGATSAMAHAPPLAGLAPSDRAWLRYIEGERLLDRAPGPALVALDEATAIADAVGNRYLAGLARVSSASLRSRTGPPGAARQAFADLITYWRGHGDRTHLLTTLRNLVTLLDRLELSGEAAELLGTVLDDSLTPTYGDERKMLDEILVRLRARLGPNELERRVAIGRSRSVDHAAQLVQHWLAADSAELAKASPTDEPLVDR
jgi:predicted ATPase/DNA-binding SARP family transcriptional activator